MKAINLINRSARWMAVQGVLVLAALVLLIPGKAEAELIVRAKIGPVQLAVNTPPPPVRCAVAPGPRVVLRSIGRPGPGLFNCDCKIHKRAPLRKRGAIWIKGHYEMRRHQGKVWIPGHWSCGAGKVKRHKGRMHR